MADELARLADRLWEALKRECCSTRPDSPDWPRVGKIVTLRKPQLVAALRALASQEKADADA